MARVVATEQAKRDLRRILSDLDERAGYGLINLADAFKLLIHNLN